MLSLRMEWVNIFIDLQLNHLIQLFRLTVLQLDCDGHLNASSRSHYDTDSVITYPQRGGGGEDSQKSSLDYPRTPLLTPHNEEDTSMSELEHSLSPHPASLKARQGRQDNLDSFNDADVDEYSTQVLLRHISDVRLN